MASRAQTHLTQLHLSIVTFCVCTRQLITRLWSLIPVEFLATILEKVASGLILILFTRRARFLFALRGSYQVVVISRWMRILKTRQKESTEDTADFSHR